MIIVRIKNSKYVGPSCWEELTPKDYLHVIAAKHATVSIDLEEYDMAKLRTELVRTLYGMKPLDFLGWRWKALFKRELRTDNDFLAAEWLNELLPLVDFMFDGTVFTKNLLPSFRHRFLRYYGPGDKLINCCGEEIEKALLFHNVYAQTNDAKYLRLLVAALYRPRRKDYDADAAGYGYDPREPFNAGVLDHRADMLQGVDPRVLLGVRYWFDTCLQFFTQRGEPLFRRTKQDNEQVDLDNFRRLFHELAGDKYGTVDEVKRTNFHEIMYQVRVLERKRKELDEMNQP